MARRYDKHREDRGSWRVIYTSTNGVVTVEGSPLEGLDEREADEAIGRLEAGELVPDPSDGP